MMMLIFNGAMLGLAVMLMTTSADPREVLFWALMAAERVVGMLSERKSECAS